MLELAATFLPRVCVLIAGGRGTHSPECMPLRQNFPGTPTVRFALRKLLKMHAKVLCLSQDSFAFVFDRPAPDEVHVLKGDELIALFPEGPSRDEARMFVADAVAGHIHAIPWPANADPLTTGMMDGSAS